MKLHREGIICDFSHLHETHEADKNVNIVAQIFKQGRILQKCKFSKIQKSLPGQEAI